jgi:uncharacterized protein YdaU (DUF1376 family)
MSGRPWYKRYGADFVHGTLGLTLEQKGAYSLCLDLIYDRGGPIPDDARWLAGVCGCSVRKWNSIRALLLEAGKLVEIDGRLTNFRAEKEIENAAKTSRKLAESGAKGGAKRAEKLGDYSENNDLYEAELKHTRINQKPEKKEKDPPNGGSKKKSQPRGTRLDVNWSPPSESWALARGLNLAQPEIESEIAKFRDYWIAQPSPRGVKLDWAATWRNWLRRAAEKKQFPPRQGAPPNGAGTDPPPGNPFARLYRRKKEEQNGLHRTDEPAEPTLDLEAEPARPSDELGLEHSSQPDRRRED